MTMAFGFWNHHDEGNVLQTRFFRSVFITLLPCLAFIHSLTRSFENALDEPRKPGNDEDDDRRRAILQPDRRKLIVTITLQKEVINHIEHEK